MADSLYAIPTQFAAGDTVAFTRSFVDGYGPDDGFTMSYKLNLAGKVTSFAATSDASRWTVTIPAADSALLNAGEYIWAEVVAKTGERHTVATGRVVVLPDPAADGSDPRTPDEIELANIRAVLHAFNTTDCQSYTVAGRSFTRQEYDKLKVREQTYAWRVARAKGTAAEYMQVTFARPR